MAEWSEDHVAAIDPFKLEPWNLCLMSNKNGDRVGPIRGISGALRREEWEECCGHFKVSVW
jgi:hypothetical protein